MVITIKCKCGRERTFDMGKIKFESEHDDTGISFYRDWGEFHVWCKCGEMEYL